VSDPPDPADGPDRALVRPGLTGPDFAPPDVARPDVAPPAGARPDLPPDPVPAPQVHPPRRVAPTRLTSRAALVTAGVFLLIAAVTTVAALVVRQADTPSPAGGGPSVSSARPADAQTPVQVLFTGARGTGQLTVLAHTWDGGSPQHLRLLVELACTAGAVDHGPQSFSVVEASGLQLLPIGPGGMGRGHLSPGERVRGEIVFELPVQDVTLVLTDRSGSVTAVRLPA
jgi:hypothetical protein